MGDGKFPGFYDPREYEGYTKLPHEFFDQELSKINSLAELKVVLYVLRHTWGFQEYDSFKKITTDEFMHGRKRRDGTRLDDGTGLSDYGVRDGLTKAIQHGYLLEDVDARDKGRIKKYYQLRMRESYKPPTDPNEKF